MKRKTRKKIILIPVCIVLVAAIGLGIWRFAGSRNSEPVYVYPFEYLGMTEYWGDSQESYGPVTTDKIQTVFLSDTQTVTEILVASGDMVKKGDLLMTFDTTLTDLALERERLGVEKLRLQLEDEKKTLKEINAMKPMKQPSSSGSDQKEENLGTALKGDYQISTKKAYDGSAPEKAIICWIGSETAIDDALFEEIRLIAEEYQTYNAEKNAASKLSSQTADYEVQLLSNLEEPTEPPVEEPTEPEPTEPPVEEPTEPEPTEPPVEEPTEPEPTEPPVEEPTQPEPTEPPAEEPTEPETDVTVDKFYIIIKTTQGDMSLAPTTAWQGLEVTREDESFRFRFFDASFVSDYTLPQSGKPESKPDMDFGSGFTSSQIAQMRSEQEKAIKDLQFQIKMAEAEYKIMQTEVGDGNIYAEIDGQVVSLLTEEEAKMMMQPILKVSGGGGFYVEGSVGELDKANLQIGQEVTVNDWNTGMTYTGTIESLGDFPSTNGGWNGMGNPNSSYYPFTVFVDGSAGLQEGSYVSVMYSAAAAQNGIYLQNPFLRTEGGRSYVYVLGEDGKLEQRFVTTGKALWGSYTEILEGLTIEDYIAFPYGKNVRDGADAVESDDMSQLYG